MKEAEAETLSTVAYFDSLPDEERSAPGTRHLHANALGQYCSVQNILGHKHEMLVAARRVTEIAPKGSSEAVKHKAAAEYLEKEIRRLLASKGGQGQSVSSPSEQVGGDVSALCPAELKVKGEEAAARWRKLEGRPPIK